MNKMPYIKQAYLGLIPIMPLGYIIIHGWRDDQFFTKFYVTRSCLPPTPSLRQLVESEMDQMENVRHPKLRVSLTNELEPKVYGGFFLNNGAEVQFPLRVSIEDVEQARRLGSNLEMDLGLAKYRRKVEVNSSVGDELISRLMLSDNAKRFIIQRQLQLANNGTYFCVPIFAWMGISAISYLIFSRMMPVIGGAASFACSALLVVVVYSQFMNQFKAYVTAKVDKETIEKGAEYFCGARDYFTSSMKFNKIMRKILGTEGEKNIEKNGDLKIDHITYSERLKNIEIFGNAKYENIGC